MTFDPSELFVTESEQEAHDLSAQCALAQCRSHVDARATITGVPYYVVVLEAEEAYTRARRVRRQMFGS